MEVHWDMREAALGESSPPYMYLLVRRCQILVEHLLPEIGLLHNRLKDE